MSADRLLYQMEHPGHSNEWFDFDNSFEFTSGYLDSDPNSVNSISPEDYTLPFPDMDPNWDLPTDLFSAPSFPDMVNYDAPIDPVLGAPMDAVGPVNHTTPTFDNTSLSPDLGLCDPAFNGDLGLNQDHAQFNYWTSSIRHMVETKAAADPSCLSSKAKRRDASIAIHLQRLHDPSIERELSSDSSTSFSSPSWSGFLQETNSPMPTALGPLVTPTVSDDSASTSPESDPAAGGMEFVLDLNMNATTNLPKKQKPRSQAQKENYIKVRKHGACEKHRKQHKRCNCLEKNATRISLQAAKPTTVHTSDPPRPQRLHTPTAQSGRILCQPGRKAPPGSTAAPADRYTCHPPGSANSNAVVPSLGESARIVPPSRRPVTDSKAAVPGLQAQNQHNVRTPQGSMPGHTPIVPGVSPIEAIPGRQPSQPTAGSNGRSTRLSPWQNHGQTPQKLLQGKENTSVTPSARLDRPKMDVRPTIAGWHSADNIGQSVARSLAAYGTTLTRNATIVLSSFWQSSTTSTSWIGFCVEKIAVLSFKHGLAIKKGLELYR